MAWPEILVPGTRVEFRGECPHVITYATVTRIEEGARDMDVVTDAGEKLRWPIWSERVKIAKECPDKTTPTVVSFTERKPTREGDYLCIRRGNAHPIFVRIRRYAGILTYLAYGEKDIPLSDIEADATWSPQILTIFE